MKSHNELISSHRQKLELFDLFDVGRVATGFAVRARHFFVIE
jgi:hypothetical protein